MPRPRRFPMALLLALVFVVAAPAANAGIGDMLKQKALKAVKGDKPKPAASETGPVKSRMTPEVTAERLDRFARALGIELAEREKSRKFLASLKTREEWEQCRTKAMSGEKFLKFAEQYSALMEKGSQEERQKGMEAMSARMDSMVAAECGPDPSKFNADQMTRTAIGMGSDAAALGDDWQYQAWKEWVLEFCNYLEQLRKQKDADQQIARIKDEGLRVPGSGAGIYYVYTATEANLLMERCPTLKPLLEGTL